MGLLQDHSSGLAAFDLALDSTTLIKAVLLGIIAIPTLLVLTDYVRVLRIRQKLPPGPLPFPLVGNFFQIPKHKPWLEFEKWAEHYNNPMFTIWQGHRPTIMCNDAWTISDLLEKRAHLYSSRPQMYVCKVFEAQMPPGKIQETLSIIKADTSLQDSNG